MTALRDALGALWMSDRILTDFAALCDSGGRLAGTQSEFDARDLLSRRLDEIGGKRQDFSFPYTGWQPGDAVVELGHGSERRRLDAVTLPGSPSAVNLELEVVDLGTGTLSDFEAASSIIPGRAILVRHEYPFTTGHTHRRFKYEWACRFGARAFVIVNNNPMGGPVTGGSGTGQDTDIPAIGVSYDSGEAIRNATDLGTTKLWLTLQAQQQTWQANNLILDIPGATDEWVVLCAHIDGHNVAESAMDNATGLATVLEVGRCLAEIVPTLRRGLRLAAFTVEEWGLDGSRQYVGQLSADERSKIRAAIALDSLTGHPRLTALTGGDPDMEQLVRSCSAGNGVPIDIVRPMLANSDHYSFQNAGIPGVRLIAGYGREESLTRHLLTPADRRTLVDPAQLKAAALTTLSLVHAACIATYAE